VLDEVEVVVVEVLLVVEVDRVVVVLELVLVVVVEVLVVVESANGTSVENAGIPVGPKSLSFAVWSRYELFNFQYPTSPDSFPASSR